MQDEDVLAEFRASKALLRWVGSSSSQSPPRKRGEVTPEKRISLVATQVWLLCVVT